MKVIVRQVPVKVLDGVFFVFLHNQEYYGIVNLSPECLNGLTRKRKPLHYSVRIEGLHRLRKDTEGAAERHRKQGGGYGRQRCCMGITP